VTIRNFGQLKMRSSLIRGLKRVAQCAALAMANLVVARAQDELTIPTDVLTQWLTLDCEVGEEGIAAQQLAGLGGQAVPALIAAANNGPDPQLLAQRQQSLAEDYVQEQAYLAKGGTPGSAPADVAALQSMSSGEYIATDMNNFVGQYQARAVQGLGVIGGPAALGAVLSLADRSPSPRVREAAQRTLQVVADIDRNGSVGCDDVLIVVKSLGRRPGQRGYDPRADIDKDGTVTAADLRIVLRALPRNAHCEPRDEDWFRESHDCR
jgi:hypothetical protein